MVNYKVQMDGGSSSGITTFNTIATQSNAALDSFLTDPVAHALVTGDIYQFRVIATNVLGDSAPSGVFSAMAAVKPGAPATPTRKTSTTQSVTLQWNAPTDNGGDPVDDYNVYWD